MNKQIYKKALIEKLLSLTRIKESEIRRAKDMLKKEQMKLREQCNQGMILLKKKGKTLQVV